MAKPEARTIYFLDAVGGALSALAAGVARSLGIPAVAVSLTPAAEVPWEILTVLEEVGMRPPEGGVHPLSSIDASDGELVFLGSEAPSALSVAALWKITVNDDAGEIERLSSRRIARDQIERRLEQTRSTKRGALPA